MNKRYKSTAFFLELVVNILVFSISCAILVALFGEAAGYSRKSAQQASMSGEVQNLVETVKARGLQGLEQSLAQGDGRVSLLYDSSWQPTDDPQAAAYEVFVGVTSRDTGAGTLVEISAAAHQYLMMVSISPFGDPLYELSTAVYLPSEGGAAV